MTRILSLSHRPELFMLLNLYLELAGYEHLQTTNNDEALFILRNEQVDLFTLDVFHTENADGLYDLMKTDENLIATPVLVIGIKSMVAPRPRVYPGDGYIAIPFGSAELLNAVITLMKREGKCVTEDERVARYEEVWPKLARAWNLSKQQLDGTYTGITHSLAQIEEVESRS